MIGAFGSSLILAANSVADKTVLVFCDCPLEQAAKSNAVTNKKGIRFLMQYKIDF
jgi:hypothetical protein